MGLEELPDHCSENIEFREKYGLDIAEANDIDILVQALLKNEWFSLSEEDQVYQRKTYRKIKIFPAYKEYFDNMVQARLDLLNEPTELFSLFKKNMDILHNL